MSVLTMGADRLAEVLTRVESLAGAEVLIGVPADAGARPGDAISNAAIGYINEHGSPEHNIPARPHLVPGVHAALPQCIAHMERGARAAMASGSAADAEAGLVRAGLTAVASVQRYLTKGDGWEALAESTLAARRAKGRTGTRPLLDTGSYRRSLNFVLRRKGV